MKILSILLSVLLLSVAPANPKVDPADLVFINGNVYTANEKQSRAEAVAVKGDRIVFVGSNTAAKKYEGPARRCCLGWPMRISISKGLAFAK